MDLLISHLVMKLQVYFLELAKQEFDGEEDNIRYHRQQFSIHSALVF